MSDASPDTGATRPLRVLIVDDSDAQRSAVRDELSEMHVELAEARGGLEAVRLAAQFLPDLVTLDIELPQFDGYRVLAQLRSREATRGLPVIMISGRANEAERFRAQESGAIAYFAKPFPQGALRALVTEILNRVANNRETLVYITAEDDTQRERLLQMVVAQGYDLSCFEGATQLLSALAISPCDILLLDLHLSDQGAYRALDHVNLITGKKPGVIGVMSKSTPADLAHAFRRGLSDFVREPFYGEELCARIEHLVTTQRQNDELEARAVLDILTGLPNRGQLERELESASSRAMRDKTPLGVLMIDVDHFKHVNDTYGHAFGDHVLRQVGRTLRACLRGSDVLGRYGGEEFMMLASKATPAGMMIVAERLRAGIECLRLNNDGVPVPITVSLGTCIWEHGALTSADIGRVVRPADAALYEAKRGGRNRVCAGATVIPDVPAPTSEQSYGADARVSRSSMLNE